MFLVDAVLWLTDHWWIGVLAFAVVALWFADDNPEELLHSRSQAIRRLLEKQQ